MKRCTNLLTVEEAPGEEEPLCPAEQQGLVVVSH